jgi:hypothetical protein
MPDRCFRSRCCPQGTPARATRTPQCSAHVHVRVRTYLVAVSLRPAAGSGQDQQVWGSLHETAKTLDILLGIVPGVVLARVGTAALKAAGYQVLDFAGTSALKDACLRKPEAAVVGIGTAGSNDGFVCRGQDATANSHTSLHPALAGRMGLISLQSLSNEDKSGTLYLPFLTGSLNKPKRSEGLEHHWKGRIRISGTSSPQYQLPTQLILRSRLSAENDSIQVRCQWLADAQTAKAHDTAVWVMEDRFLSQTISIKSKGVGNKGWVSEAVRDCFINLILWRLNVAHMHAGSLWWQVSPAPTPSPSTLAPVLPRLVCVSLSASVSRDRRRQPAMLLLLLLLLGCSARACVATCIRVCLVCLGGAAVCVLSLSVRWGRGGVGRV